MIAKKQGVYSGNYGNRFFVIDVNAGGFRFHLHCDQSSVVPHIKVYDQEEKLDQLADLVVSLLNKGDEHCNGDEREVAPAAAKEGGEK